jgi:hypothetical protein
VPCYLLPLVLVLPLPLLLSMMIAAQNDPMNWDG